ncbi:uncharacterized protein LOC111871932 isoform X2 [Cryptotermes secundus]|uniref:uncharacterized protein LOC111871932 isoform X2 n=1 Tax=Cryptotermes secundus TaxID=105785 RepID=UPI000CD7DE32|nr:uncharacterized protein LOC111871932 isoform X2 [Cryptotermes secundus]
MPDLRKLVSCLEQHNGMQLTDAVPCLVEVLNMNSAVLKSVNINSLIQIGYYVLEGASVHHKETNEYISRLVATLLNSAVDENNELKVMQEKFLLSVWCRTDTISLPLHLQERLTNEWKLYLQRLLLDLIVRCHSVCDTQYQQNFAKIFASPDMIYFLNICRRSPLIFQATVMTFTTFLIHKKGCAIIGSLMKEFIKLVEYYSKEKLSSLFPPRYKVLVSCLQVNPDLNTSGSECDIKVGETHSNHDSDALDLSKVMELLVKTFRENKYSGMALLGCFPVWVPYLVKYYFQKYNKNFFTDFYF